MRYYKHVENNFLIYIGTGDGVGTEINKTEYNSISSIINNKPADNETHYYMLNDETLEYEALERSEPIILPEPTYTLDEAATLLAQEVNA